MASQTTPTLRTLVQRCDTLRSDQRVSDVAPLLKKGGTTVFVCLEAGSAYVLTPLSFLRSRSPDSRLAALCERPIRVDVNSSVSAAAQAMIESGLPALPVFEDDELAGVVTARSLVNILVGRRVGVKLTSVMNRNPAVIASDATIAAAQLAMLASKQEQLPVVSHGKMTGVLNAADLVGALTAPFDKVTRGAFGVNPRGAGAARVSDMYLENPVTCEVTEDYRSALSKMISSGLDYVVFTLSDEVQGLARALDFLKPLAPPVPRGKPLITLSGLEQASVEWYMIRDALSRIYVRASRTCGPGVHVHADVKKLGTHRNMYELALLIRAGNHSHHFNIVGYDFESLVKGIEEKAKRGVTKPNTLSRTRGPRARGTGAEV